MDYWEKRAARRQRQIDAACESMQKRVHRVLAKAEAKAAQQSLQILRNYMRAFGLSRDDALKILRNPITEDERKLILSNVLQMPEGKEKKRMLAQLSADAYRYRMTREDALVMNTQAIFGEATGQIIDITHTPLVEMTREITNEELYELQKRIGIGFQVDCTSTRAAEAALKERWMGTGYADRMWRNSWKMGSDVADVMLEYATSGEIDMEQFNLISRHMKVDVPSKRIHKFGDLEKRLEELIDRKGHDAGLAQFAKETGLDEAGFNKIRARARYAADRLIVTETSYLAGRATMNAYDETGIERYQYRATLEKHTCERCAELDGQVFAVAEQKVGVNMHPLHPWCRCHTAPYFDGIDMSRLKRAAMNEDGTTELVPENMTYKQWEAWQKAGRPVSAEEWIQGKRRKALTDAEVDAILGRKAREEIREHLETPAKGKGIISGAHRRDVFEQEIAKRGGIITSRKKSVDVEGFEIVTYRMPNGNGGYKPTEHRKSVYDQNVISTDEVIRRGLEASAVRIKSNGITNGKFEGIDEYSVVWKILIENNQVTSVYVER